MKRFLARGAAIAAFTLQALTAHAAALPGPLVDSQWLADHLADVQVVDVRGSVLYVDSGGLTGGYVGEMNVGVKGRTLRVLPTGLIVQ